MFTFRCMCQQGPWSKFKIYKRSLLPHTYFATLFMCIYCIFYYFWWWLIFPCFCEHFYITKTIICKNYNLCVDLERRGVQVLSNPPPEKIKIMPQTPHPPGKLIFYLEPPLLPQKKFLIPYTEYAQKQIKLYFIRQFHIQKHEYDKDESI